MGIATIISKGINVLKEFQKLKFLFMLGGGIALTAMAAWYTWILVTFPWDVSTELERIKILGVGLWIILGLIGAVMISLAFGQPESLKLGNGVISGEITFDDDDENKTEEDK